MNHISPVDVAAIAALKAEAEARRTTLAPTLIVAETADKQAMARALARINADWDIDGSIVFGRVDTTDGDRYYIAHSPKTLLVHDPKVVVIDISHAKAQDAWVNATEAQPGPTRLKRHLVIEGWTITESRDEFDFRQQIPDGSMVPDATDDLVEELDLLQRNAERAVAMAAEAIVEGRAVDQGIPDTLATWNGAIAQAAQRVGLPPQGASLSAITNQLARMGKQRELHAAIDEVRAFVELGGPAAPRLAALLADLEAELAGSDAG